MKTLTCTLVFVSLLVLVAFSGAIVRGWDANPKTLMTQEDAISLCVRGVATGAYPVLEFPTCVRLMLHRANWHRQVGVLTLLTRDLEESARRVEESKQGFKPYLDSEILAEPDST